MARKKKVDPVVFSITAHEWAEDWWDKQPKRKTKEARRKQREQFKADFAPWLHEHDPEHYPDVSDRDFWDAYEV